MAVLQINFFSQKLVRYVNITAILPIDKRYIDGERPWTREDKPFKSLYLLHGIHGCEQDWLTGSRIKRFAMERNLAVFMPAGENKMYNHLDATHDWFDEYVAEELVEFTRAMFPLSTKREDTFIAGLSMGAYGAMCNGLRYSETFGYIGGLSTGIFEEFPADDNVIGVVGRRSQFVSCLGDPAGYENGPNCLYNIVREHKASGKPFPKIFMVIGTSDFFLDVNRRFKAFLDEEGVEHTYMEAPGGHDWEFWDTHVVDFLNWLPLERRKPDKENS